jgi:hypothetical protein
MGQKTILPLRAPPIFFLHPFSFLSPPQRHFPADAVAAFAGGSCLPAGAALAFADGVLELVAAVGGVEGHRSRTRRTWRLPMVAAAATFHGLDGGLEFGDEAGWGLAWPRSSTRATMADRAARRRLGAWRRGGMELDLAAPAPAFAWPRGTAGERREGPMWPPLR